GEHRSRQLSKRSDGPVLFRLHRLWNTQRKAFGLPGKNASRQMDHPLRALSAKKGNDGLTPSSRQTGQSDNPMLCKQTFPWDGVDRRRLHGHTTGPRNESRQSTPLLLGADIPNRDVAGQSQLNRMDLTFKWSRSTATGRFGGRSIGTHKLVVGHWVKGD